MGPVNESNGTRVVFFTTPVVPFWVFQAGSPHVTSFRMLIDRPNIQNSGASFGNVR